MRTIERRLKRLEGRHKPARADIPTVVFICPANGEPVAAMRPGGQSVEREPGETVEAFEARAVVILPAKDCSE